MVERVGLRRARNADGAAAAVVLTVPPPNARGALARRPARIGEILLKGTGLNPESLESANRLQVSSSVRREVSREVVSVQGAARESGLDGRFVLREGAFDILNSELLSKIGVLVTKPVALVQTE